jgi:hypothetical protein
VSSIPASEALDITNKIKKILVYRHVGHGYLSLPRPKKIRALSALPIIFLFIGYPHTPKHRVLRVRGV